MLAVVPLFLCLVFLSDHRVLPLNVCGRDCAECAGSFSFLNGGWGRVLVGQGGLQLFMSIERIA